MLKVLPTQFSVASAAPELVYCTTQLCYFQTFKIVVFQLPVKPQHWPVQQQSLRPQQNYPQYVQNVPATSTQSSFYPQSSSLVKHEHFHYHYPTKDSHYSGHHPTIDQIKPLSARLDILG